MTKNVLFMTQAEKTREKKHNEIVSLYRKIKETYPDQPNNRVFKAMEGTVGYTPLTIRKVLIARGIIQAKTRV